jgi:multidrug efflux system membrane fusion protein
VSNPLRVLCSSRLRVPVGLACLAVSLTFVGCSQPSASGTPAAAGGRGGRGGRGGGGAAQPVVVAKVTQKDVPVDITAVGNVEAYTLIALRSQITGVMQEVLLHEGDTVKKGDLLFKIDERPFRAALQQADANYVRDQALLAQSEAQLVRDSANAKYTALQADRQSQLVEQGIISKDVGEQSRSQADAQAATVKADNAAVASAKAQLVAQQAAVDNAKVQLEYCNVRSPIDGRSGDITVKAGNLVTANNTQIMTIAQVAPVYVTFAVPAVHLPTIKEHYSGPKKLIVTATPQDADAQPVEGQLTFFDNVVDQTTDTIKLKATFANANRALWPGQYARVSLRLATIEGATVVPQQAVQTGQDGQFVFLVKGDSTVEQRPVTVGQRVNDDLVIQKGLKAGDTVVTEGQLRLEQGTKVDTGDGTGRTGGRGTGRGTRGAGRGRAAAATGADQSGSAAATDKTASPAVTDKTASPAAGDQAGRAGQGTRGARGARRGGQ